MTSGYIEESYDRIASRLVEEADHLDVLEANASDPTKDVRGESSSSLAMSYRFLGVAMWIVERDIEKAREWLRKSALVWLNIFNRHENGERIAASYVTMLSYKNLFDALAAGVWDVANELAERMGGRPKIEKYHDHPFDYAMGYTLKWFVLGQRHEMAASLERLRAQCDKRGNANFRGYVRVFQAILDDNLGEANEGLRQVVQGHEKESKGRGVFKYTPDEALCVWGVGMANLCRRDGLPVDPVPPLIPGELLIAGT